MPKGLRYRLSIRVWVKQDPLYRSWKEAVDAGRKLVENEEDYRVDPEAVEE
jgi:hypothetical protein